MAAAECGSLDFAARRPVVSASRTGRDVPPRAKRALREDIPSGVAPPHPPDCSRGDRPRRLPARSPGPGGRRHVPDRHPGRLLGLRARATTHYQAGTGTAVTGCHRSLKAWGYQVVLPDGHTVQTDYDNGTASVQFLACHRRARRRTSPTSPFNGEGPQLDRMFIDRDPRLRQHLGQRPQLRLDPQPVRSQVGGRAASLSLTERARRTSLAAIASLKQTLQKVHLKAPTAEIILTGYASPVVSCHSLAFTSSYGGLQDSGDRLHPAAGEVGGRCSRRHHEHQVRRHQVDLRRTCRRRAQQRVLVLRVRVRLADRSAVPWRTLHPNASVSRRSRRSSRRRCSSPSRARPSSRAARLVSA